MKDKYLLTVENWFTAPDGKQYKSFWGECEFLDNHFLGKVIQIGNDENHIIIKETEIKNMIKCNSINLNEVEDYHINGYDEVINNIIPSRIYAPVPPNNFLNINWNKIFNY